ncbi:MAG: alginate export family protein [Gemmatimonadetes bacterium]|nr:alginate export family protein [Gemmatimonadota bacterium]
MSASRKIAARAIGIACACLLAVSTAKAGGRFVAPQEASIAVDSAAHPAAKRADRKAPAPKRPEFRPLRFDEQWPDLSGARQGWNDALKHIPLAPHDLAWVTFGGQLRWREESVRDFQFFAAPTMQNDFGVSRTLLSGDLHVGTATGPYLRGFAEMRDAQGYDRRLPGGVRSNEEDRHDWQNSFVEGGWGATGIRLGRQDVILGRERLVGISDWTNSRRSFDGLRVQSVLGPLAFDVLDAHVMAVRMDLPNRPDSTTRFRYIAVGAAQTATARRSFVPATWQLYVLQLDAVLGPRHERTTYGSTAQWKAPVFGASGAQASFEYEAAEQRGWQGDKVINAWFFATEAQVVFRRAPGAPTLIAGYDKASGDKDPNDTQAGTFTALYASAHSHGGIADVFGRGNLAELRGGVTADAASWLDLGLVTRSFSRVELADGVYNKQNTLFRAASGNTARDVGVETDFTATVKLGRNLRLLGGIAEVDPGRFMKQTPGGGGVQRFSFAGTTITF